MRTSRPGKSESGCVSSGIVPGLAGACAKELPMTLMPPAVIIADTNATALYETSVPVLLMNGSSDFADEIVAHPNTAVWRGSLAGLGLRVTLRSQESKQESEQSEQQERAQRQRPVDADDSAGNSNGD